MIMKSLLVFALLMVAPPIGLAQSEVWFSNRNPGVGVLAPVYGINPAAPSMRLSGNGITNGGAVDYTGVPLLSGTTYTASFWAARLEVTDVNQFQMLATAPFRDSAQFAGFWLQPVNGVIVPFVMRPTDRLFNAQIRVWDNQNGTITSWAQALANPTVGGMGYSEVFTLPVVSRDAPAAYLQGLTSFNLTVVPEPSALALGLLCATTLWLVRRHQSHQRQPSSPSDLGKDFGGGRLLPARAAGGKSFWLNSS